MILQYACKHIADDEIPDDHQSRATWADRVKLPCPTCRSNATLVASSESADLHKRIAQADLGGETYANFPTRDMAPVLGMDTSPLQVRTVARTATPGGIASHNGNIDARIKSLKASGQLTADARAALRERSTRAHGPRINEREIRAAIARLSIVYRQPNRLRNALARTYGGKPDDYRQWVPG